MNCSSDAGGLGSGRCGVLPTMVANSLIGPAAVRWRLQDGRWQRPCRGVLVTNSGPLTRDQRLWVAVLRAGPGSALAGLTAAGLDGLTGFDERRIHLVVPAARQVRAGMPGVIVHRSRVLGPADLHPVRQPPRTRIARSILDAAAWAGTDNVARAILAAGVQQRLVRAEDLAATLARRPRLRRHLLISVTLADIAGGAEALSELDFCHLTRKHGLPEPDRQVLRHDSCGRRRWLDAYWEEARLVAEVDGLWHMDPTAWWSDMRRDNDLTVSGHRVLRFPAFVVRSQPELVASQIAAALWSGSRHPSAEPVRRA